MKIKLLNRKKSISVIILVFLFTYIPAYTQTSFEKIKNWGDDLFTYYDTARQGNDFYNNEFKILQSFPTDAYEKLDTNTIAKLFNYFNTNTIDTNHYIRQNRFKILYQLYTKATSVTLAQRILEVMFLPQYYQYWGELNSTIYTDEITPLCKTRIIDFLNEKMDDSVAQKIVYYKIKYSKRFDIENLKKIYPNKYINPVNELLDSIAKINIKENGNGYKNWVFSQSSAINFISGIVGDKFWKDLSLLIEKKYLQQVQQKKDYSSYILRLLEVLSRFNYKNYKTIYLHNQIDESKTRIYISKDALPGYGINYFSLYGPIYAESFGCIEFYCKKIYDDSAKFYMCPGFRFLGKGEKQKKAYWSNDYQQNFIQVFSISNSINWRAFSPQNEEIFNKAGADEIKKWLSKYTQKTFPFNKYDGYYKFPKSRK